MTSPLSKNKYLALASGALASCNKSNNEFFEPTWERGDLTAIPPTRRCLHCWRERVIVQSFHPKVFHLPNPDPKHDMQSIYRLFTVRKPSAVVRQFLEKSAFPQKKKKKKKELLSLEKSPSTTDINNAFRRRRSHNYFHNQ